MPKASHSERLTAQVETLLASLDEALDEDPSAQPTASRTASLTSSLLADSAMAPPPTPGGGSGLFASIGAPAFVSPFSMRTGSPFGTRAAASISPFAAAAAASAQSSPSDGAPPPLTPAPSSDGAGGGGRARGASLGELESQLLADRPAMATSCAPLSRDEWTERLSTFSREHLWARKPACVSPPSCARRGWTLVGLDTLRCSACGARLHIPRSLTAAENHARLVELVETSAHLPLCPWRGNASPESISRLLLPAATPDWPPSLITSVPAALDALRARYRALLKLPALPRLNDEALQAQYAACAPLVGLADAPAVREALLALVGRQPTRSEPLEPVERLHTAAALAVLGWRPKKQITMGLPMLECPEDARTLSLALFALGTSKGAPATPHPNPDETVLATIRADGLGGTPGGGWGGRAGGREGVREGGRGDGAAAREPGDEEGCTGERRKRARLAALPPLDPVAEHRVWSPWLEVTAGDSLPAWMRIFALVHGGGGVAEDTRSLKEAVESACETLALAC